MIPKKWPRAATVAFTTALLLSAGARASAPQVRAPAPGYYRLMIGDIEVTPLNDGTFPMPVDKLLTGITPQEIDAALARSFLKAPVESSVNGFLINTGTKLVLIDTGSGAFGPTSGGLLSNLKASGYKPEQVDEIYITHFHGDHIGGLLAGDKAAFPNAVVRCSQQEADFWLSSANRDAAPADRRQGFQRAMDALAPYVAAGHFKPFNGGLVELVAGVKAQSAFGHTPGHTVYVVESGGQKLLLWGDLMHVAAVQFGDPPAAMRFDSDSAAAVAQRQKIFADAGAKGYWVAGAHLPFPGVGHMRPADSGSGYVFVPANFGQPH